MPLNTCLQTPDVLGRSAPELLLPVEGAVDPEPVERSGFVRRSFVWSGPQDVLDAVDPRLCRARPTRAILHRKHGTGCQNRSSASRLPNEKTRQARSTTRLAWVVSRDRLNDVATETSVAAADEVIMTGRRGFNRFTLPAASWEGELRVLHDVVNAERSEDGELVLISHEPGIVGEVLLLDRTVSGRDVTTQVRVLESQPVVLDGSVRHRLRLEELRTDGAGPTVGVLAREVDVRMLNFSHSGCLLESRASMKVGTVGTMRLTLNGKQHVEDVQVVRCQEIQGAGSVYHVGVRFLWTSLARRWAFDRSIRRHVGNLSAWLSTSQPAGDAR